MSRIVSNIFIYGAGAVGSVLGWRISQRRASRVWTLCRSNYDVVRQHGFRFQTQSWGPGTFHPHKVLPDTRGFGHHCFDYVILANKLNGQSSPALDVEALIGPNTTIVLTQNGIGNEGLFRTLYPSTTILSAVCNISCEQKTPGFVTTSSQIQPHAFYVGLFDREDDTMCQKRLKDFVELDASLLRAVDDVHRIRWAKLVFNAAWNPTSALLGKNTRQILDSGPAAVRVVQALAQEAFDVGSQYVSGLDPTLPMQAIELPRTLPPITPSMLQDVQCRRPLEIGPLCKNLVALAKRVNVRVPLTEGVCTMLENMSMSFRDAPSGHLSFHSWPYSHLTLESSLYLTSRLDQC